MKTLPFVVLAAAGATGLGLLCGWAAGREGEMIVGPALFFEEDSEGSFDGTLQDLQVEDEEVGDEDQVEEGEVDDGKELFPSILVKSARRLRQRKV